MKMSEKVATDQKEDVIISTVRMSDYAWFGEYETAVCYDGKVHPVMGYTTIEEALRGHQYFLSLSVSELKQLEELQPETKEVFKFATHEMTDEMREAFEAFVEGAVFRPLETEIDKDKN